MTRSGKLTSPVVLLVLLSVLCVAAISVAADVDKYSFPAFDANTTDALVAATNRSVLQPAQLLFRGDQFFPEVNASEGFLLLAATVDVWSSGSGADDSAGSVGPRIVTGPVRPAREASFNTSFTVGISSSASPVSFVILPDRYPTFNNPVGLRGANGSAQATGAEPNATDGLVHVQVGAVRSYEPESPDVGLNVTITPNTTAAAVAQSAPGSRRAVWIEYDAADHRLRVYLGAGGGESRPPRALLEEPLNLAASTTRDALVGFFAGAVRDAIVGVRDWDLTVDRLDDGDGKKGTSWVVILVSVLGSLAATAAIVSLVVCCLVSRRRCRNPSDS
ncbi:uncharacterized protein LOC100845445 [Brachypodium distachyon]|uniref:Legume lectin domain-containing protein n=1 Tax=Brachypodium distachyon TaxID=15368 RepID=I1GY64_BRADI|nr:uncharacterized protein LOC100845445 [Brachypodium distachyon]KQK18074.1 hypothetical protein BRADI_1g38525v3 [Brachypodium distachyon]|eukprot:XP_003560682.1 uncharacterized protein LOC100845445 [Brachypodium distachyon]